MEFLLVEDDKITTLSICKILNNEFHSTDIIKTENGQEALNYLKNCSKNELPHFIMLDLNMPIMNGVEFLSFIRQDDRFSNLPVVIHTTSSNLEDYLECVKLGISGYFVKNVDFKKFKETLIDIVKYWKNSFNNRT